MFYLTAFERKVLIGAAAIILAGSLIRFIPACYRFIQPVVLSKSETVVVNINTASAVQLEKLSGIGPSLAERIVDYRRNNGEFVQIDDLAKVKGIGVKKMERIRPRIIIEDAVNE